MDFKNHFVLSFFFFLLCCADAFNITQLLNQYPDFSTFNTYLTQTQLAENINSRRTITVLVVDNDNIAPLQGKSADQLEDIMAVHVILDYYDVARLQRLPNKSTLVTTLFQTSGQAIGQQGFLNLTDLSTGSVVIGSAAKGATLGANVVKSIAAQPFNISVLQISNVIIPLGLDNSTNSPPSPPHPAPAHSPTPAQSPTPATPPSKSPPSKSSPSKSPPSPTPSPDSPPPAASPPMPSKPPRRSPPKPDAPTADAPTADAPAADNHPPSAGITLRISHGAIFMIVSSLLWLVAIV